jgi:hypothetical protein
VGEVKEQEKPEGGMPVRPGSAVELRTPSQSKVSRAFDD